MKLIPNNICYVSGRLTPLSRLAPRAGDASSTASSDKFLSLAITRPSRGRLIIATNLYQSTLSTIGHHKHFLIDLGKSNISTTMLVSVTAALSALVVATQAFLLPSSGFSAEQKKAIEMMAPPGLSIPLVFPCHNCPFRTVSNDGVVVWKDDVKNSLVSQPTWTGDYFCRTNTVPRSSTSPSHMNPTFFS